MDSRTPSLIPYNIHQFTPLLDPSKVLSTLLSSATDNPLTFILGQVHNPAKLLGVFTDPIPVSLSRRRFLIIGAVLLLLIGLIVTGSVLGLIILTPLIIALSPIWVPAGIGVFIVTVGFLSMCGFGVVVAASGAWLVERFFNPPDSGGSNQVLITAKDPVPST